MIPSWGAVRCALQICVCEGAGNVRVRKSQGFLLGSWMIDHVVLERDSRASRGFGVHSEASGVVVVRLCRRRHVGVALEYARVIGVLQLCKW